MSNPQLMAMGKFEDAPNDRLVVRVLGRRLGTSDGWMHWANWCVVVPGFVPDPEFLQYCLNKVGGTLPAENLGLMIDYYSGEWLLIGNLKQGNKIDDVKVLLNGTVEDLGVPL